MDGAIQCKRRDSTERGLIEVAEALMFMISAKSYLGRRDLSHPSFKSETDPGISAGITLH